MDVSYAEINPSRNAVKEESVKSGESKLKIFSFEPSPSSKQDIEKCIDFWKFIETRNDLMPAHSFKVTAAAAHEAENEKHSESCKKEELNWEGALNILKAHNLHKLAGVHKTSNKKKCDAPSPGEGRKMRNNDDDYDIEDTFDLGELKDWDPHRKYYADQSVETDPILTEDKQIQTEDNVVDEEEEDRLQEELQHVYDELSSTIEQLAEMYNYVEPNTECTCSECKCLEEIAMRHDKCTCSSCGESKCLCTQLSRIIEEVQLANRQLDVIPEECECRHCTCINDCKFILNGQIDISMLLTEHLEEEDGDHMIQMKECTCNEADCICKMIMKLHATITYAMKECCTIIEYNYLQLPPQQVERSSAQNDTSIAIQESEALPQQYATLEILSCDSIMSSATHSSTISTGIASTSFNSPINTQSIGCLPNSSLIVERKSSFPPILAHEREQQRKKHNAEQRIHKLSENLARSKDDKQQGCNCTKKHVYQEEVTPSSLHEKSTDSSSRKSIRNHF